jgi:hypothetical protein
MHLCDPPPFLCRVCSQRGLLAVGFNSHVQVWRDALTTKAKDPYMRHELPGNRVEGLRFRPYEDILGVGHAQGFATMVRVHAVCPPIGKEPHPAVVCFSKPHVVCCINPRSCVGCLAAG